MSSRNTIAMLNVLIGAQTKQFDQAMKKSESKLGSFQKSVNRLPGLIGGAFAVGQIVQFTAESAKLAGEVEGVERAFKSIDGANLDNLRTATRGTVNDLELMKAAVNARNFEIPFSKLGKLFEFATQRAADTGQEVNKLVADIITGLGRKSPLILDNLGISAVKLKEHLEGVGLQSATTADITRALTEVIDEQNEAFGNTGESVLTAGQKIQTFQTQVDNLKASFGKIVTQSGFLDFLTQVTNGLDQFTKTGFLNRDGFMDALIEQEKQQKKNALVLKQVNMILKDYAGTEEKYLRAAKNNVNIAEIRAGVMAVLKERIDAANAEQAKYTTLTADQQKVVDKLNSALTKVAATQGIIGTEVSRNKDRTKLYQNALVDLIALGVIPANTELKKLQGLLSGEKTKKAVFVSPETIKALDVFEQFKGDKYAEMMAALSLEFRIFDQGVKELTETTGLYVEETSLLDGTFTALGGNMVSTFNSMIVTGKLGVKSILKMLGQLIAKLIAAAAAAAILAALLPGGEGKLSGAFTFGDKFKTLFSGLAFAKGGNPPVGKYSMVGENGPEMIRPRSAMNVVPNHALSGMGSGGGMSTIRIVGQFIQRGEDMILAIDQTNRLNGRYSG